jgi:hypothetical protein
LLDVPADQSGIEDASRKTQEISTVKLDNIALASSPIVITYNGYEGSTHEAEAEEALPPDVGTRQHEEERRWQLTTNHWGLRMGKLTVGNRDDPESGSTSEIRAASADCW